MNWYCSYINSYTCIHAYMIIVMQTVLAIYIQRLDLAVWIKGQLVLCMAGLVINVQWPNFPVRGRGLRGSWTIIWLRGSWVIIRLKWSWAIACWSIATMTPLFCKTNVYTLCMCRYISNLSTLILIPLLPVSIILFLLSLELYIATYVKLSKTHFN